jgi:sulfofructose kinase
MPVPSILVAGVAVIDFVFEVDKMPDRPQKYRAQDAYITGGGNAANAAVAISRLGGRSLLAARLGDDAIADLILAGLQSDAVDTHLVRRFAGRRSSFSSVFVDAGGERQIVNFRDMDLSQDAGWLEAERLQGLSAVLADTRWGKGAAAAMELARNTGVPGIIDAEAPVREAHDALCIASHVAFSMQGLADLTGSEDARGGLLKARTELDAWLCVTDGGNGAWYLAGETPVHVPAFQVDAVDTLGAGDVWHGAFALMLAKGTAEKEAMRFANAAAAVKCSRSGGRTGYPTREEAQRLLSQAQGSA